jgi:hypothetical protein
VSEVAAGEVFDVDQAAILMNKAVPYYEKHGLLEQKKVYVANRIHLYSVKPTGWFNFEHAKTYLHGYCVVNNNRIGVLNALLESNFVPINFKSVQSLDAAIEWCRSTQMDNIARSTD